jgi:site-specific recombinase XerD
MSQVGIFFFLVASPGWLTRICKERLPEGIADCCAIIKHLTFHIARHTFAMTVTLGNGVPIETVFKMLGHRNLKTT